MIALPKLHYWTVNGWMSRPGMGQSGLSIWASPQFIEDSLEYLASADLDRLKGRAYELVKQAGWEHVIPTEVFMFFNDEVGLAGIQVPGNACDLGLDHSSHHDYARDGYRLEPHNVDGPLQQSTLMAIWMMWANAVEAHVYFRDRRGATDAE